MKHAKHTALRKTNGFTRVKPARKQVSAPQDSEIGQSVEEIEKIEVGSARNQASRSRSRDEFGRLELRPGQAEIGSRLDDEMETKVLGFITLGMSDTDACLLAGLDRSTFHRWKTKGEERIGSRYALFLERLDLAAVRCKAAMVEKLRLSDDPRWTWRLMCSKWRTEFSDHVTNELTGPNGMPLALASNPFNVVVNMAPGSEDIVFKTIDHRSTNPTPEPPMIKPILPVRRPQSSSKPVDPDDPLGGRLNH